LLTHPQVEKKLPELAFAARALRQAERKKGRGCGSCGRGQRARRALESAKNKIGGMPPARLKVVKNMLGLVNQSAKIKVFIRRGNRVVPITV